MKSLIIGILSVLSLYVSAQGIESDQTCYQRKLKGQELTFCFDMPLARQDVQRPITSLSIYSKSQSRNFQINLLQCSESYYHNINCIYSAVAQSEPINNVLQISYLSPMTCNFRQGPDCIDFTFNGLRFEKTL
jgi:hypothetical protein